MDANARHYHAREILRNGLEVVIRAARPDDAERIVEAFKELQAESIYMRFFGFKKEITEAELQSFRQMDFDSQVTLLCAVERDGRERVIATGTYVRTSEDSAEVAFTVEEDYQGLGLCKRLLTHLGTIAVAKGLETFTAEVLPHNNAMLRVFQNCGWPMKSRTSEGVVQVTLDLRNP